jgi:hypothetical protein
MPGRAKPGQPKSQAKQIVGKRVGNGPGKGPGKGDGWGGPAKGAGKPYFAKGETQEGQGRGHTAPYVEKREDRLAMLRDHIWNLAMTAQREETQLAAANAYLDREEGKPIARTVTATVDDVSQLSDLELAAEIARLDRELAAAKTRSGEAPAGEPSGAVSPVH